MPYAKLTSLLSLLLIHSLQNVNSASAAAADGSEPNGPFSMFVLTLILFPLAAAASVAFFTLFFGAFAVPPVLGLKWLYRGAVQRWMSRPGGSAGAPQERPSGPTTMPTPPSSNLQFEVHDPDTSHGQDACPLNRRAEEASRTVARVYVTAGIVYAVAMTPLVAFFTHNFQNQPNTQTLFGHGSSYPVTFAALLWLPVLVYMVIGAARPSRKLMVLAAYLLLHTTVEFFLPWASFTWILLMSAPTSTLLVLRFSGIGGLALGTVLSLAATAFPLGFKVYNYLVGKAPEQSLSNWYLLFLLVAPFVGTVLALGLLWWTSHRYARKRTSEQMLLLDGFWLGTTFMMTFISAFEVGWYAPLGLLPFALYKLVVWAGLRRLERCRQEGRELRLLLLRVFGAKRRSEWLLKRLGYYWRYAGSIQLIAAPDLAAANLELDELLDFMRGRLKRRFIKNTEDCARRVESLDVRPDPDGRYRVNEFFCHDDVWHETVSALTRRSDAVLMDLRGFTPKNRGCVDELHHLVNAVAINRLVITVNDQTDHVYLRRTFEAAWANMGADSPNRDLRSPALRMLHIRRQNSRAVRRLLSMLGEAAGSDAREAAPTRAPITAQVAAELQA
jgi:hypothetical protein